MTIEQDLAKIAQHEAVLVFKQFDECTAWELGSRLKAAAEKRGAALAIDVTLGGSTVFFCAMPGATPNSANWVRRKRATTLFFHRSSYGVGQQLTRDKADLTAKFGLAVADFAVAGGSFPLRVTGTGVVGAVTVSGQPQREDHKLIVEVLAEFLGVPLAGLELDLA